MNETFPNKRRFKVGGKDIALYLSETHGSPVIYLNTFGEAGDEVYQALCDGGGADFTLAAISGLSWNEEMSPWAIPPISKGGEPCTGGADGYLRFLEDRIVPEVEGRIAGGVPWRGIAGYSLAGLFAVYATCRTACFARAASVSGSLWFPGFVEFISSHGRMGGVQRMYFSLGDREHRTRNLYLKAVRENTEEVAAFYRAAGVRTVFENNPGNHFQDEAARTAAGIRWIAG